MRLYVRVHVPGLHTAKSRNLRREPRFGTDRTLARGVRVVACCEYSIACITRYSTLTDRRWGAPAPAQDQEFQVGPHPRKACYEEHKAHSARIVHIFERARERESVEVIDSHIVADNGQADVDRGSEREVARQKQPWVVTSAFRAPGLP